MHDIFSQLLQYITFVYRIFSKFIRHDGHFMKIAFSKAMLYLVYFILTFYKPVHSKVNKNVYIYLDITQGSYKSH